MDVDLIFKIAAVGILVAVLNILLQRSAGADDDDRRAGRGADGRGAEDQ